MCGFYFHLNVYLRKILKKQSIIILLNVRETLPGQILNFAQVFWCFFFHLLISNTCNLICLIKNYSPVYLSYILYYIILYICRCIFLLVYIAQKVKLGEENITLFIVQLFVIFAQYYF